MNAQTTNDRKTDGVGARWALGNWSLVGHSGLVIATFLAMLTATWLKWPDPLVDFGRELYVPWQITQGKALYRDIAYFNGPLSPYFNALMFSLLGVSLRTLVVVNVILLGLLTAIMWRMLSLIADRTAATVGCVVMLTVFSFIQLVPTGNYNFITPYSHELTHGMVLSMLGMVCLSRFIDRRRGIYALLIGIIIGLIFLTKPEVTLAAAVSLMAGVLLSRPSRRAVGRVAIGIFAPPLGALLLLCLKMPLATAMRGVMGGWMYVLSPQLRQMDFYRRGMGTLDVVGNLKSALICGAVYLILLLPGIALARYVKGRSVGVLIGSTVIAAAVFWWVDLSYWQDALRGFTVVVPVIAVITIVLATVRPLPIRVLRAAFSVFAAVMLAKIFFDVRVMHYGFALALPAMLLVISAGLGWLPGWLDQHGGSGNGVRATLIPLVALFIFVHLFVYARDYAKKSTLVGTGKDAFLADPIGTRAPRGLMVNLAVKQLDALPPQSTLAVLPEGVMVNYLSRKTNPTGYITLMPPEMAMFGQERVLEAFKLHPPDFILMQQMSVLSEYNLGDFESGFGEPIYRWIQGNYTLAWQHPPLMLLKKR